MYNYLLGGAKKLIDSNCDERFYDEITSTKLLSENTKNNYINKMNIVQNEFFEKKQSIYWILHHPQEFKTALLKFGQKTKGRLGNKELSPGTLNNFVIPFIHSLNRNQAIQEATPNLYHLWKVVRDEISEPINAQYDSNEPNKRQSDGFIPMSEIVKIRDNLPNGSEARLLISMYTLISPLRNNFENVKLLVETPKEEYKGNYMVLNKTPTLYLNRYKTDKMYDTLKIPLPRELVDQIEYSLKKHARQYLFVNTRGDAYNNANTFNKYANSLLKKVFKNKAFSLTMFRHAYLSDPDLDLENKSREERKEIAHSMGHSLMSQDKYYWKDME